MKFKVFKSLLLVIVMLLSNFSSAEEEPAVQIDWKRGPATYQVANKANIFTPEEYVFLGTDETDKYLRMSQNIPDGTRHFFGPINDKWDAYLSFDPVGYVEDKEDLNSDSLLQDAIGGQKESNKERRKKKWDTLTVLGWEFEPQYDKSNNLLEWAFLIKNDTTEEKLVNYETRILGRNGVMKVTLVTAPDDLHASVLDFKEKIRGFKFNSGEKYSEYREGDRVAEFGLAALITGGAAALASKKGFWAAIVAFFIAAKKLVLVAAIGFFAWIVSFFRRK
ncbi:MAG TPA: DUF2167 domain-containing protein [Alphaproteobacteria bacterium]|jgi:uncharacterized membrane-anchored protein|nr:DUF2167 domain-containing protein [Alphaproteobacteria bacterium]